MARVKATFEISDEAKFRLATLKAELRRAGIPATEALIIEKLIMAANKRTLVMSLK